LGGGPLSQPHFLPTFFFWQGGEGKKKKDRGPFKGMFILFFFFSFLLTCFCVLKRAGGYNFLKKSSKPFLLCCEGSAKGGAGGGTAFFPKASNGGPYFRGPLCKFICAAFFSGWEKASRKTKTPSSSYKTGKKKKKKKKISWHCIPGMEKHPGPQPPGEFLLYMAEKKTWFQKKTFFVFPAPHKKGFCFARGGFFKIGFPGAGK